MATPERAWANLRVAVGRVLGPRSSARTGWFFVVRRQLVERINRALARRPCRAAHEMVELDDLRRDWPAVDVREAVPSERLPGVAVSSARSPGFARFLAEPWATRAVHLLEIPDGWVFSHQGWIGLDPSHLLVTGAMEPWSLPLNDKRRTVEASRRSPVMELPGRTVSLLNPANGNYAHALLQSMPLLDAVVRAVGVEQLDRVLVPDNGRAFWVEMVRRWGIEPERILRVPTDAVQYRCERLLTGTLPPSDFLGRRAVVEPIRAHFGAELEAGAAAPRRRWYLTRGSGWYRHVENERTLVGLLERRGFEPLIMDDRSVAEQAELLARAEFVVGVHGAAMANVVFAPPGTPVIELMPANLRAPMYSRLCIAAGLRYDLVLGCEPCPPEWLYVPQLDADLVVDPDELATVLDTRLAA